MGRFERHLSLWVAASILVGVALGRLSPESVARVARFEWAGINLVVAGLIWVMIYPMMLAVEPRCILQVGRKPKGVALTVVVNWLIKPFTMAGLAALFFRYIFSSQVPAAEADEYIASMILLGVAPCTAMVFVWSQLTRGDAAYTLVQVTINDLILVVAFTPLAGWLLGVTDISVPWDTLALSVLLFVVIPLSAGLCTRFLLPAPVREERLRRIGQRLKPWSIVGLLATVVLLFAFQAETLVGEPQRVLMIAAPLLVQSYGIFCVGYLAARAMRLEHSVAAPAALIGTSNFFELAVAVAIGLFGLQSGAALATVVGVLIEVPVMLSLVHFCNRTRHWFPSATATP